MLVASRLLFEGEEVHLCRQMDTVVDVAEYIRLLKDEEPED